MNKIRVTAVASAIVLLGGGAYAYRRADAHEAPVYKTATVERGSLHASVSATGTLGAVTTVQVGTQVSGQISAIYVDFNDKVKKGQLLARIDPTLQQQGVADAQAGVTRANAQYTAAKLEYDRQKQLFERKVVTEAEWQTAQSNYVVAQANLRSAQISLDKARQNLSYTNIYSPIDGIIVERNVDVGQTVAASLSAPQIFLIANDLSQMQILASVDESDIGSIKEGQPVQFSVQSYPNDTFTGTVKQVRLQSKTTDNVVNYTAVVAVQNASGKLLPGMTATVDFTTGSAENALLVPAAALKFRPSAEELAKLGAGRDTTKRDSTQRRQWSGAQGTQGTQGGQGARRQRPANSGTLWTLDAAGKLKPVRVKTGLSDGQKTAVESATLTEGTKVVTGTQSTTAAATTNASSASPFGPQGGRGGAGGPRGGF